MVAIASACDGGFGRERGIVGRIGRELGVSFAFGQHFGIAGTSLTQARLPDESPGIHGGYKGVIGGDYSRSLGVLKLQAEYAAFRDGELGASDKEVLDVTATLQPAITRSVTLGYSVATHPDINSLRLQGSFLIAQTLWLEPWVRTRNGRIFDTGITLRVRL
jgi:hypothetical protein